jgi:hypothetical protein
MTEITMDNYILPFSFRQMGLADQAQLDLETAIFGEGDSFTEGITHQAMTRKTQTLRSDWNDPSVTG